MATLTLGLQRVLKVIGQGLSSLPGITTVTTAPLHEPKTSDLPMVRMAWVTRNAGYIGNPRAVSEVDAVETDYRYEPIAAGTHSGAAGSTLIDPDADFTGGDAPIAVGDKVRNLTTGDIGTVVGVTSSTELETDISFSDGDSYDVHWPEDALEVHILSHRAVLELDIMTFPAATVESGQRLDQLELAIESWLWGDGEEPLREQEVEVVDVNHISPALGPTETGLGADRYRRSILEVELKIGAYGTARKRTIESAPGPYDKNPTPPPKGGFVFDFSDMGGE